MRPCYPLHRHCVGCTAVCCAPRYPPCPRPLLSLSDPLSPPRQMSDTILGRIDEMGNRIDDLEKSIGDLMQQAGVEEKDLQ